MGKPSNNRTNVTGYVSPISNREFRYVSKKFVEKHAEHIQRPVFLTLNFKQHNFSNVRDSTKLDDHTASDDVRLWYNKLNRKYYGQKSNTSRYSGDKLKLLEYMSFREISDNGMLHYHVIIERPEHILLKDFKHDCATIWVKLKNAYPLRYCEEMLSVGAAIYSAKHCDKNQIKGMLDDYNCFFKPQNLFKLDERKLKHDFMYGLHKNDLFEEFYH